MQLGDWVKACPDVAPICQVGKGLSLPTCRWLHEMAQLPCCWMCCCPSLFLWRPGRKPYYVLNGVRNLSVSNWTSPRSPCTTCGTWIAVSQVEVLIWVSSLRTESCHDLLIALKPFYPQNFTTLKLSMHKNIVFWFWEPNSTVGNCWTMQVHGTTEKTFWLW